MIFKLIDDPVYTGFVVNVVFEEGGRVELDYTMHWTPKAGTEPPGGRDWAETVRRAVLQTKALAEERAGADRS